jgi:cell pole-organizing protein PopZ
MEEILASIRRIIESNEPATDQSMAQQTNYSDDELDEAEEMTFVPERAANDRGQPIAARAPLSYATEAAQAAPAQTGERAMSLADVAARVRAASVRQQEAGPLRAMNFPSSLSPSAQPAERPAERVEERSFEQSPVTERAPEPVRPLAEATPLRPSIEPTAEPQRRETQRFTHIREPERVEPSAMTQSFEPEPSDDHQSLPARIEETARLLSVEAGAQVARSFNELAAVFNGLERRSVEDMAQEMLRPMLHEWLDDNLPTLVERLVREEIERVARGPRR